MGGSEPAMSSVALEVAPDARSESLELLARIFEPASVTAPVSTPKVTAEAAEIQSACFDDVQRPEIKAALRAQRLLSRARKCTKTCRAGHKPASVSSRPLVRKTIWRKVRKVRSGADAVQREPAPLPEAPLDIMASTSDQPELAVMSQMISPSHICTGQDE